MSTISKTNDNQEADQQNTNITLTDLISTDKSKLYLENNKRALICFEEFIKLQTNKNKNNNNNKLSLYLLNINGFSNLEKYKKNPILILKSYGKNIIDKKKKKFKSQTLGVDEGLITLPKNDFDINLFDNLKNTDSSRLLFSNLDLKNVKDTNNYDLLNKALFKTLTNVPKKNNNNISLSARSFSHKKNRIKITDLERGRELISKSKIGTKRNNAEIFFTKMKKLKEDFDQQLKYNFELRKLNNWEFSNLSKNKKANLNKTFSKNKIMNFNNLNEEESSNMGWLLNIRNDKEKLKVVSRIKQLNDFFIGFGKEQDAFFMQAMNKDKKGFIFDAFGKSKEEIGDNKASESEIKSGVHFYREVMKVKTKREDMFKSEVSECAEKLWKEKLAKQNNIISSFNLLNELEELKKKESDLFNELTLNAKNQIHVSKMKEKERIKNEKKVNEEKPKKNNNSNNILFHRENRDSRESQDKKDSSEFGESIDKKMSKRNIMLKIQMDNEKILKKLSDLKKGKMLIEEKLKKNHILLNEIQIRLKKAKVNYTEKVQMLSEYYYQILKKGIDVRRTGLSWVVVKLMELNSFIDKNHFPSFLNDSEINYLMRIGIKTFELNELVKLFQLLKIRQKKLRERHVQEDKQRENQIKEEQFNKLKEANKGNKYNIGNDYVEYMEEIQRKYEHEINACLNEKTEENDINQISEKFKKQILSMHDENIDNIQMSKLYELYFIPGSLAQYFSKDKIFRQYFDDIFYLNEEINKRRKELKEEKEKEYKKYRNLNIINNYVKILQGNETSKYQRVSEQDKIMAALFGNDISV